MRTIIGNSGRNETWDMFAWPSSIDKNQEVAP